MANVEYPLLIRATTCANGETHEFRLMLGDTPVRSVFRSVFRGDSLREHAIAALLDILDGKGIKP